MPLKKPCNYCKFKLRDVNNPGYSVNTIGGNNLPTMSSNKTFRPYIFPMGFDRKSEHATFKIFVPHEDGYGKVIIDKIKFCPMCGRKLRNPWPYDQE